MVFRSQWRSGVWGSGERRRLRAATALLLSVSPRVIRVVRKGMHLRVFHEVCCSIEVLLSSINTVRCSLVLRQC
jgi:hypothetical protein